MPALRYEEQLTRAEALWPHRTAVVCDGRRLTFSELAGRARALGYALAAKGLSDGDSIADLRENSLENLICDFGCAYAGRPRVPLNPRLSDEEIAGLLGLCRPRYLLADAPQAARIRAAGLDARVEEVIDPCSFEALIASGGPRPARSPDPLLLIQPTSGTTGLPKGSLRTHDAQAWVAACMLMDLVNLGPDDVFVHSQPFNVGTHLFVLPCVMRGATQVIVSRPGAQTTLDAIAATGATVLKCVPTLVHRMLEALGDAPAPPTLRQIIYAAAPMPEPVLRRALARFGPILTQTYGQTEIPGALTHLSAHDHELGLDDRPQLLRSAGRPYSAVDVRITDHQGESLPSGEVGAVAVRAPFASSGYFAREGNLPQTHDGLILTGDLGYLDPDGYLFLTGRAKDTIITGGYNVAPRQVEDVLAEHPAVSQAIVIGVPDEEWGQVVAAAVTLWGRATEEELIAHCRGRLAKYKVPTEIQIFTVLPTTAGDKPDRRTLADAWRPGRSQKAGG